MRFLKLVICHNVFFSFFIKITSHTIYKCIHKMQLCDLFNSTVLWCNWSHCCHPTGLRLWLLLLVHGWVGQRKICRLVDLVFEFAHFVLCALPNSFLNVIMLSVWICKQARRWSSSALGKVFSTTPSRATMPVSLPMDKLVNYLLKEFSVSWLILRDQFLFVCNSCITISSRPPSNWSHFPVHYVWLHVNKKNLVTWLLPSTSVLLGLKNTLWAKF